MKKLTKVPVQIYLDPEQNRIIARLSKVSGMSRAAIIRSCITKYIQDLPLEQDPALGIVGLGASGKDDISENHDAYLTASDQRAQ